MLKKNFTAFSDLMSRLSLDVDWKIRPFGFVVKVKRFCAIHATLSFPVGTFKVNLLKPTVHVMHHHHQFNIQQLYALPTLYLCVLYLSENKQRLVPLTA